MASVTLREMAKALGVSAATVSMVLNNKPGISAETRAKVLEYAHDCGYELPRGAGGGTLCFAIYKRHGEVVRDTPFFSTLIESIQQAAARAGHALAIQYLSGEQDALPKAEGIIFLATEMDGQTALRLAAQDCPVVMLDNAFPDLALNTVSIDNRSGICAAIRHLAGQGHRAIGYLRSSAPIQNFDDRFAAYQAALAQRGLEQGQVIPLSANMDAANRDMLTWLSHNRLQSRALIADNDAIAFGAIAALRSEGLEPGRDYAVIGFDDLPYAQVLNLTTVRVFHESLGAEAVRRVLSIDPSLPPQHIQICTQLKVRGST